MRTRPWWAAGVLAVMLVACAATGTGPSPQIRQDLAPTGRLRVGVYPGSPTSMLRDPVSGEIKGVSVDIGRELARHLGVPYEQVEYRRIAEVIEALKTGAADFTISNASPARARDVNFTQPLLAIELGCLVPQGSPFSTFADVDRPGIRIGVTQGSTSSRTLPQRLASAAVVAAPTLQAAVDMLSRRELDAFATNKAILFEMSDKLPGSRVLEGRWGVEELAIALPKGRDQGMAYMREFIKEVTARGLVARAAERAGLRGTVSPDPH